MLLLQIEISQKECNQLIIKNKTPLYSPDYVGGYGGINIEAENITWTELTIMFGRNQTYVIGSDISPTEDWFLNAYDIPTLPAPKPNDCDSCNNNAVIKSDKHGFMTTFPSGCITLRYEVYSGQESDQYGRKLEGVKVIQFVSTCAQEKRLIALADKLTLPLGTPLSFPTTQTVDERRDMMNNVVLSWLKIQNLETNEGCDCDCLAGTLKMIDSYIDEATRWTL